MISPTISHSSFNELLFTNISDEKDDKIGPQIHEATLIVKGMTCAACSCSIESSLRGQLNLKSVKIDLLNQSVRVESEEELKISRVVEIIKETGFTVVASSSDWRCRLEAHKRTENQEFKAIRKRFIEIFFFSIPVLISSHLNNYLALIFSIPLHLYAAFDLYVMALKSNCMERLIMMSCLSSLLYSLVYFGRQHEMFDCAAVVLILFTGGKLIEAILKRRIVGNCDSLLTMMTRNNDSFMKIGQIYELKEGDLIPIDSEVIEGNLFVEESTLTGEPLPKNKTINDHVLAGTRVYCGEGKVQAIRSLENSFLNKLARAVFEPMMSSKGKSRQDTGIAEKVSRVFIPMILGLSFMTFLIWFLILWMSSGRLGDLIPEWRDTKKYPSSALSAAFYFGLTVLCIACPCALSVASPVAQAVAKGVALKRGFVLRDLDKFEGAHRVNVLLFDKTGTLTTGKPTIEYKEILTVPWILEACQAIEGRILETQEHPIARAIYSYCKRYRSSKHYCKEEISIVVHSVESIQGSGVVGNVQINEKSHVIKISKSNRDWQFQTPQSCSIVQIDDETIGEFSWFDELKPEALDTINQFRRQNVRLGLISGDSRGATERTASKFLPGTFTFVFGSCKPADKARIVDDLRQQGNLVAFCGDGLNDSMAMTRADFSISLDPLATSYPSVSLFNPNFLLLLPKIFHLSRQLDRQIRFNLFWAALYNALALPLAMGMAIPFGLAPIGPEIATALMVLSGSSIIVTSILFLST